MMSNGQQPLLCAFGMICVVTVCFASRGVVVYNQRCGGKLQGNHGVFQSPYFPRSYPKNIYCKWEIIVPEKYYQVNFFFIWFDVGTPKKSRRDHCPDDYVRIEQEFDGVMESAGEYCGLLQSFRARATAQKVEIVLKGYRRRRKTGFRVVWFATREGFACSERCNGFRFDGHFDTYLTISMTYLGLAQFLNASYSGTPNPTTESYLVVLRTDTRNNKWCGGLLYGKTKGTINTPGYPLLFRSHLRCRWIIHAPYNDSKIKIRLLQFEKSSWLDMCKMEKMTIKDEKSKKIAEVCDNSVSNELEINSRTASIYFRGDGFRGFGFIAKWNVEHQTQNMTVTMCGNPDYYHRKSSRKRRVVGGDDSTENHWPWLVQVVAILSQSGRQRTLIRCGGTIISDRWIITAAHCVEFNWPALYYQIRVPSSSPNSVGSDMLEVETLVKHPQYAGGLYNDIALIKLKRKIDFDYYQLVPVCLPGRDGPFRIEYGHGCKIAGWGRTETNGIASSKPLTADVTYHGQCSLTGGFVCAGADDNSKGACEGDSGGPLLCEIKEGRYFLGGVLSHGPSQCGFGDDLYVDTNYYQKWIQENILKDSSNTISNESSMEND